MSKFFSIPVKNIDKLTDDSVCIKFDLSSIDTGLFNFKSGQYITIEKEINNTKVRRSYSISSSPGQGIEIGVKLVPNGLMSTFLTKELKEGDNLDIMPPVGEFTLEVNSKNIKKYVAICSGSGITPILSMIRNVLISESKSTFTLIYGNKSVSSVMFSNELKDFELEYKDRFLIFNAYSRESVNDSIKGRIDEKSLKKLFDANKDILDVDYYFICGPGNMTENIKNFLEINNIDKDRIKYELFSSPSQGDVSKNKIDAGNIISNVTVCVDGDNFEFELSQNSKSVLDTAIDAGADVPFSCKGGVCSVCKAKIIEGSASMDMNYSLSDDDIEEGYILTCQAHPTSDSLYVDYDEV